MAKKILGIILNIFIVIAVIIIILVVYSMVQTKMMKKDYVNIAGFTILQVATGSMSPTMEEKDIIVAKILSKEQALSLGIDDIVIYQEKNYMITHRIVKVEKDEFVTKGDANNTSDNPIKKDEVIGKVVHIISDIGIWEKVLTEPQVYISIMMTITLWGITFLYKPEKKVNTTGEKANENKGDEKKE